MASELSVVVWATGGVGSIAARAVHRRPGLRLVGVWAHSPDKGGVDVGTLLGDEPYGVEITTSADDIMALAPDCVCYCGAGPGNEDATHADYERLLRAGINVVTVSTPGLVHPAGFDAAVTERLAAAAAAGNATLYASGIEPGFAADQLVLTLLTMSDTIASVRAQELFSYADYPVEFVMFEVFGFGQHLEHQPIMALPGMQAQAWAPPVRMVADALGTPLDEIRETYDRRVTDRRLDVASGVIEAGTVGAIRMETIGVVDGRDAIVIEHVNRMADDLAPDWPRADSDGTYRIVVEGTPSFQCEMTLGAPGTASEHGMVATTMRIVNAIAAVFAAPPGLPSALDLPLTLPTSPFR
jgi:hypothetical protein